MSVDAVRSGVCTEPTQYGLTCAETTERVLYMFYKSLWNLLANTMKGVRELMKHNRGASTAGKACELSKGTKQVVFLDQRVSTVGMVFFCGASGGVTDGVVCVKCAAQWSACQWLESL